MIVMCIDVSLIVGVSGGFRLPVCAHLSEVLNNNRWTYFDSFD